MTDIPADIMRAAMDAYDNAAPRTPVTQIIARAIVAERERCASLLDAASSHFAEKAKAASDRRRAVSYESVSIAMEAASSEIRSPERAGE